MKYLKSQKVLQKATSEIWDCKFFLSLLLHEQATRRCFLLQSMDIIGFFFLFTVIILYTSNNQVPVDTNSLLKNIKIWGIDNLGSKNVESSLCLEEGWNPE